MKDRQYIFNEVLAVNKWANKKYSLVKFGNILSGELGKIVMLINDFSQNRSESARDIRSRLVCLASLSVWGVYKIDAGKADFLPQKTNFDQIPAFNSCDVSIFNEIIAERERQDIKHGDKNETLTLQQFGNVLTEEVCEVVTDINDFAKNDYNPKNLREELVQVAALAVAGIEKIDAKDVAFLYPQAHIYFQLLKAELSFKYSMGVKIKLLGKNTLPTPKTIAMLDRYAGVADSVGYAVKNVQDFDCEFQVWEFWAYDRNVGTWVCSGLIYNDTYPHHAKWQAYGFSGIDTQRCYDLACKMVGLIS